MLAVDVGLVATLGEQLPDLFDQPLDHDLRGGGRWQAARRTSRQERAQQRGAGENQLATAEQNQIDGHDAGPPLGAVFAPLASWDDLQAA
jgi:hypothetical protein